MCGVISKMLDQSFGPLHQPRPSVGLRNFYPLLNIRRQVD
jgi:hypothetical protein